MMQIKHNKKLIIIGAGSLGIMTLDAVLEMNKYKSIYFIDDGKVDGSKVMGYPVIGGINMISTLNIEKYDFVIAISNNQARRQISQEYSLNYTNIIHPKTSISRFAKIKGKGNIILSHTSIDPNVEISNHVVINKNNSIGHDTKLNDYTQVSPGCSLGGFVTLEEQSFLGLGVSILPNKIIGHDSIVGAGGVVTSNIPNNKTVIGMPAKEV